jgi:hypothetical protein
MALPELKAIAEKGNPFTAKKEGENRMLKEGFGK